MSNRDMDDRQWHYRGSDLSDLHDENRYFTRLGGEPYGWDYQRPFPRVERERALPWGPAMDPDHSGRGPKTYRRPDDRILDEINQRLTTSPEIDATHIWVDCKGGEVTLIGPVSSLEEKHAAERIADRVFGVKVVHSKLEIRKPVEPRPPAER